MTDKIIITNRDEIKDIISQLEDTMFKSISEGRTIEMEVDFRTVETVSGGDYKNIFNDRTVDIQMCGLKAITIKL